ncbi:hypothetical protein [Xanthomonas albilineans]|uniref:hypothetical protein n=1 Tax=Xanthomonas albilineans TaxID=29447 RepID=UPI0005F35755|nr:hypothetical protein [Xanthomonas albilineans]
MTTFTARTLRNAAPVACVAYVFAADPPISAGKNHGSMGECDSVRHVGAAERDTEAKADWRATKEASATSVKVDSVNSAVKCSGLVKTKMQHDQAVSEAKMSGVGRTVVVSGLKIGAVMS